MRLLLLLLLSFSSSSSSSSSSSLYHHHHYHPSFPLQECELRISPSEPCGLTKESFHTSWDTFLAHRNALPTCTKGDAHGR